MFLVNQYICKMDFFMWLMDKDEIGFELCKFEDIVINIDFDLVGLNFFFIYLKQDLL